MTSKKIIARFLRIDVYIIAKGDAPRKVHENLIATSAIGTIHSLDRIFEFRNLLAASNWNQHGNECSDLIKKYESVVDRKSNVGISALVDYYIQASVDIANEDTPIDQIEVAACMMAMQVSNKYSQNGRVARRADI